jgi:hypothetical protein
MSTRPRANGPHHELNYFFLPLRLCLVFRLSLAPPLAGQQWRVKKGQQRRDQGRTVETGSDQAALDTTRGDET